MRLKREVIPLFFYFKIKYLKLIHKLLRYNICRRKKWKIYHC